MPASLLNALQSGGGDGLKQLGNRFDRAVQLLTQIAYGSESASNQAQQGVMVQTETARGIADQTMNMLEALLFVAGYSSGQFDQITEVLGDELLPITELASVQGYR